MNLAEVGGNGVMVETINRGPQKEYRVVARVKNNLLLKAIEATDEGNVAQFCRKHNFCPNYVGGLINMTRRPIDKNGEFTKRAITVCDALGMSPFELFTEHQMKTLNTGIKEIEVGEEDILTALEGVVLNQTPESIVITDQARISINNVIDSLQPRQQRILRMRYGFDGNEMTLREIGKREGIGVERARQLIEDAERQLKHPAHRKILRAALREVQQ